MSERALMFAHLKRMPELRRYLDEFEVAMMNWATSSWNSWCRDWFEEEAVSCNDGFHGRYFEYMRYHLRKELSAIWRDNLTFMEGLIALCRAIRRN